MEGEQDQEAVRSVDRIPGQLEPWELEGESPAFRACGLDMAYVY